MAFRKYGTVAPHCSSDLRPRNVSCDTAVWCSVVQCGAVCSVMQCEVWCSVQCGAVCSVVQCEVWCSVQCGAVWCSDHAMCDHV